MNTYFIRMSRNGQDHWTSQSKQRTDIFKCGIPFNNIQWESGRSGPNMDSTHLWKITCSDKCLTMVLLKTSGIIETTFDEV